MKKVILLGISILTLFLGKKVYATDTMVSYNKYQEETLDWILPSSEEDGYLVAGSSKQKKNSQEQVMILMYGKDSTLKWDYIYHKTGESKLKGMSYSYSSDHKVDAYLFLIENEEVEKKERVLLKLDLEGQLVEEKIIEVRNSEEDKSWIELNDGYLLTEIEEEKVFLTKYDFSLNVVWKKRVNDESYKEVRDVVFIKEQGIFLLLEKEENFEIIRCNLDGTMVKKIKEDFEKEDSPHLKEDNSSLLLYGSTNEVKLDNKTSSSYYLKKYDLEGEELWETIGDTPMEEDSILKLDVLQEDKGYYLLIKNDSDDSYEVLEFDIEGLLKKKVKKIKNDYYDFHNFITNGTTIYFIGQIDCPEDDNCDYHENSLFLISDEDKVIEIKENDSTFIIIFTTVVVLATITIYIIRKKKEQKEQIKPKKKH